jgi:hypothetical protein
MNHFHILFKNFIFSILRTGFHSSCSLIQATRNLRIFFITQEINFVVGIKHLIDSHKKYLYLHDILANTKGFR